MTPRKMDAADAQTDQTFDEFGFPVTGEQQMAENGS